ncbi:MAG: efflux RND transporter periplasmic adaptor subunit [Verrucomicrobiota bacterium]
MNIIIRPHFIVGLLAFTLTVGCKPKEEHAEGDAHAGHAHAAVGHATAKDAQGRPMCGEHNVPEAECGICKPQKITAMASGEAMKVRLPSTNSATLVGVQLATATVGEMAEAVECYAELGYNQNKLAQIVTPVSGIVQSVDVDLGNLIEEKQIVARIWSATIAEAVAKAVLTHQTLDRERKLRNEKVTSQKDLQEAEATHRAACQQLRTVGFTEAQIDELQGKPQESVLLEVRAPFAGEIIERTAVRGSLLEAGKPLFTLADRSTVWAMLNLPETALDKVRTGQSVELQVEALPGRTFTGKLTWIGPEVDERTRMARARAEVSNPDGVLRSRMFAQARILIRTHDRALLLPESALQYLESKPLVFVKLEEDLFDARAIRLGARHQGLVEVLAGLKPQEQVVIQHGFAIKSQLLSSRMGAGCAD